TEFAASLEAFVAPLVEPGRVNSLAQALLKLTSPGVPDLYQGCELWDHSLVDPDNRRPVDFSVREQLLAEAEAAAGPADVWPAVEKRGQRGWGWCPPAWCWAWPATGPAPRSGCPTATGPTCSTPPGRSLEARSPSPTSWPPFPSPCWSVRPDPRVSCNRRS